MKRVFTFVGVLGTVLLFSCTKNSVSTQLSANKAVTSLENLDPNQYLLRFGGDFEAVQDTKVLTDPETGAQVFESGDEVRVYVPATSMEGLYVYDDVEDFFKPKDPEHAVAVGANTAYVYYPADSFQIEDGQVTFTMSSSAEELPGLKTPLAGIIPAGARLAENPVVTFKNLGSVLHFSFDSEHADGETITGLTLSCTGAALAGSGLVTWSGDTVESEPQLQALDGASTVEVALAEPRHLEAGVPAHAYFFLPATGECKDLKVTAVYGKKVEDAVYAPSESFVRAEPLALSRGKLITVEKALTGFFGGGDGSAEHPYLIASADDFKAIAPLANATSAAGGNGYDAEAGRTFFGSAGVHYQQTANLDFEGENINNYMISTPDISFQGTYSGKVGDSQYSLSNFKLEREPTGGDKDGTALFKNIENAILTGISIVGADVSGGKFTAVLAGRMEGAGATVQNCSISDSRIIDIKGIDYGAGGLIGGIYGGIVSNCSGTDLTFSTVTENKQYFGGLITYTNGNVTVSGCSLNGTTTVTDAQKFGGIVVQINNDNVRIEDCHNHSTINGTKNYNGGICGLASKGVISGCTNDGDITGVNSTAGIVAQLDGATVDHCTNSGTIHGSENYAAGIVAYHTKGNLTNSVNTGAISADGAYAGGIAGMLKSSAAYGLIKGCRSNATLSGKNDVAGIVGRVTFGVVMDCFAKGSATGGINTGGIVGYAYSTDGNVAVLNCLASVDVTCTASGNQHSGGVIGRATCTATKYVYIGNCAGLDNVLTATEANAVRFGAFTGFCNAESGSGTATPDRVRIWNSYTLVDDDHFQCANTSATADVGGFVGRMGAASDVGDCYYINDGTKSTVNASAKNLTRTTAAVIQGTGNISVNPTRQGLSLDDTFLNVLNRCTYASNGTTRLTAFSDYPMCDWTMTGAKGEALTHPVQTSLVALGEDFYE